MSDHLYDLFTERCAEEILEWLRANTKIEEDSEQEGRIVDNYVELRCQGFPPSLTITTNPRKAKE